AAEAWTRAAEGADRPGDRRSDGAHAEPGGFVDLTRDEREGLSRRGSEGGPIHRRADRDDVRMHRRAPQGVLADAGGEGCLARDPEIGAAVAFEHDVVEPPGKDAFPRRDGAGETARDQGPEVLRIEDDVGDRAAELRRSGGPAGYR